MHVIDERPSRHDVEQGGPFDLSPFRLEDAMQDRRERGLRLAPSSGCSEEDVVPIGQGLDGLGLDRQEPRKAPEQRIEAPRDPLTQTPMLFARRGAHRSTPWAHPGASFDLVLTCMPAKDAPPARTCHASIVLAISRTSLISVPSSALPMSKPRFLKIRSMRPLSRVVRATTRRRPQRSETSRQ
jgi:hypothetical protein